MNKYLEKIAQSEHSTNRSTLGQVGRGLVSPRWQHNHIAGQYDKQPETGVLADEAKGRARYLGRGAAEGLAGGALLGFLGYKFAPMKSTAMLNRFAGAVGSVGAKVIPKVQGKTIPLSGGKKVEIPEMFMGMLEDKRLLKNVVVGKEEANVASGVAARKMGEQYGGVLGSAAATLLTSGPSTIRRGYNAYHGAMLGGAAGVGHGLYASAKNQGDEHHSNYSAY